MIDVFLAIAGIALYTFLIFILGFAAGDEKEDE